METVLIIEDDPAILLGIKKNLQYEGYEVLTASEGTTGLQLAVDKAPDIVILDLMLPRINGFEICKTLKRSEIGSAIIILSAKDQEIDKIMGLDLGADDYITKPFSIRELVARINAVQRRRRQHERKDESYQFGQCEVNFAAQLLKRAGEPVELSTREFLLLKFMIDNHDKVLERKVILNKVWGYEYDGTARTIDNFVTKLRQKVEEDPTNPKHILTVRGIGYKFVSG